MMIMEQFRAGLGRLYRAFDRKPPTEEKVEALYQRLKRYHSYVWDKAVEALSCESTFPSFADIRLECQEWSRRLNAEPGVLPTLPTDAECCTPAEHAFWSETFRMAVAGRPPREVAEYAARGLDDPELVRAHPVIRDAMYRWARMGDCWAPWDHPEDADHLRTLPRRGGNVLAGMRA